MVGARNSILVGVIAVGIGMGVGTALGLLAAARGAGWKKPSCAWPTSRLPSLPCCWPSCSPPCSGAGIVNSIIAIGIFYIPTFARVTRASVTPCGRANTSWPPRACGKGPWRITLEHVLPNIPSVLIVQATIQLRWPSWPKRRCRTWGLGTQPPEPLWGRMLERGADPHVPGPLLAVWPGVAIALAVLGLNLLGDGLRDVFLRPPPGEKR